MGLESNATVAASICSAGASADLLCICRSPLAAASICSTIPLSLRQVEDAESPEEDVLDDGICAAKVKARHGSPPDITTYVVIGDLTPVLSQHLVVIKTLL